MRITADVRRYAEEEGISADEALEKGMAEKSKGFAEQGAQVYQKA